VDGRIDFYNNSAATTDVVADLFGYYTSAATGSTYTPAGPTRVLDTRKAIGVSTTTPVAAGASISLQIEGANGVPASGVTAAVLNITATAGTGSGYLTAYPDGTTLPTASNVAWSTGQTIPDLAIVAVGTDGKVDFHNTSAGTVHIVADLFGYYTSAATGSTYTPAGPLRVLDTRNATGVTTTTPVAAGASVSLTIGGANGVPASGISAVVLNVTVTGGTGQGYLTAYPDGVALPTASNVAWSTGQTIPNLVIVAVGTDGKVDFHNTSAGTVHIIADLFGYYTT
jgi:hypothetical protein